MKSENLLGLQRKLKEIIGDNSKEQEILDLFPHWINMPLFFKGDRVKTDGETIEVDKVDMKGGSYIYYFTNEEGQQWYVKEDEIEK